MRKAEFKGGQEGCEGGSPEAVPAAWRRGDGGDHGTHAAVGSGGADTVHVLGAVNPVRHNLSARSLSAPRANVTGARVAPSACQGACCASPATLHTP